MSLTTLPTVTLPVGGDELTLIDKIHKGEITEHPDMERLQMLDEHLSKGGSLTLMFKVTKVPDNEAIEKQIKNRKKL